MAKVLQIINSPEMGGAEKLVADLAVILNQRGCTTDVLYLRQPDTPLLRDLKEHTAGKVFSLGMGSVYNPLLIFKIMRYLRRYDAVHVHLFPALYWVAMAKWLSGSRAKFIYTEHSTSNNRRNKWYFKIADRLFYRAYHKIVAISPQVQDNLQKHVGYPDSRFLCIANGIRLERFTQAKPYARESFFNQGGPILIQVSSFRYPKDQLTVVRGLALLPADVSLLLVGTGPLQDQVKIEVARLGLDSRVRFLDNRMDVPQLLKTADIVVLSSHYEGLSLSSLEGMASRAFVAAQAPGLASITAGAGLLFTPGSPESFAGAIQSLISDPEYRQEVAAACLERASQYDIKNTVQQYQQLYEP